MSAKIQTRTASMAIPVIFLINNRFFIFFFSFLFRPRRVPEDNSYYIMFIIKYTINLNNLSILLNDRPLDMDDGVTDALKNDHKKPKYNPHLGP